MALSETAKKKSLVVIGLNSGTSADGVDLAAVRVKTGRKPYQVQFLCGMIRKYPRSVRAALDKFVESETATVTPTPNDVIYLDQALGKFFGKACRAFINKLRSERINVDLIASHGQTVRHLPAKIEYAGTRVNGTLQLGSLDQIAVITDKIVTGDFRQADIALGHEGAPITVAAMHELFAHRRQSRLIVNIGGMSNYFYFPRLSGSGYPRAADCGPGNYLSDQLTRHFYSRPYDKNGRCASRGTIDDKLLASLLKHPFFKTKRTSTGVEDFGANLVKKILLLGERREIQPDNLIATVATLTARSIAKTVRPLLNKDKGLTKLYLTGGGVRNTFIKEKLQTELPSVEVTSIDELGLDPDQTEAVAYAIMGVACVKARPMPTKFDGWPQKLWPVSGRIVQPPVKQTEKKKKRKYSK